MLRLPVGANRMGLLLLFLAGALYFATHDNGLRPGEIEGGDLPTLQYAQIEGRPANGPGYPIYVMGGFLWFHGVRFLQKTLFSALPNPIPIFSTYNTVWALLALWIYYRLLLRLTPSKWSLGPRWLIPWLICLFYACTGSFWFYANYSEQYCSVVAQTLALVLLFLKWEEALASDAPEAGSESGEGGAMRLLYAMSFLCGLFLAHQVTSTMIVPPLALAVLHRQPSLLRRPKVVLTTVLAAAAPLLGYLFVYLRVAAHPEWRGHGTFASDLEWFWHFVSTPQGQEEIRMGLQSGLPLLAQGFPHLIWQELSIPALVSGLVGIAFLGPRLRFLLYGTVGLYVWFAWVNRFGNWGSIVVPSYPLILIGLLPTALSMQRKIAQSLVSFLPGKGAATAAVAVPAIVFLAATSWSVTSSWDRANQRDRAGDTALDLPAMLLAQGLPARTSLYADFPVRVGLYYLVTAWGLRPEMDPLPLERAVEHVEGGGRVAVTVDAARHLLGRVGSGDLELHRIAPDWILLSQSSGDMELPAPRSADAYALGEGIALKGFSALPSPVPLVPTTDSCLPCREALGALDVTLFWGVEKGSSPGDWSISLRAFAEGAPVTTEAGAPARRDGPGPVDGLRPFSAIGPGSTVVDAYRLPAAAGADSLHLTLYRQVEGGFEHLAELTIPLR